MLVGSSKRNKKRTHFIVACVNLTLFYFISFFLCTQSISVLPWNINLPSVSLATLTLPTECAAQHLLLSRFLRCNYITICGARLKGVQNRLR